MKIFEITLPLPPTDNHTYGVKGRIHFMYKEAKDWKNLAQSLAKKMWELKPMECPIWMDVKIYLKRERDLQGGLKILCDSFEGIVYENDKQITEMTLHKEFDKDNPRVEIKIEDL